MGKLDDFLGRDKAQAQPRLDGLEWFASVQCQTCGKRVDDQTLFPSEQLLVWVCDAGHKSFIEGYTAF